MPYYICEPFHILKMHLRLGDEVGTVMKSTYLGDSVSAVGGCEAAVTVRTKCGWFVFR